MTRESLSNTEWLRTVDRFGGAALLEQEARELGAFERARRIKCALDQLRLVVAYCWGAGGLRRWDWRRCRTSRFSSGCETLCLGLNDWFVGCSVRPRTSDAWPRRKVGRCAWSMPRRCQRLDGTIVKPVGYGAYIRCSIWRVSALRSLI